MVFQCSLCFEKLDLARSDDVFVTPCAHVFHKHCLEEAIRVKGECPLCRAAISNNSIKKLVITTDDVYDGASPETVRLIQENEEKKDEIEKNWLNRIQQLEKQNRELKAEREHLLLEKKYDEREKGNLMAKNFDAEYEIKYLQNASRLDTERFERLRDEKRKLEVEKIKLEVRNRALEGQNQVSDNHKRKLQMEKKMLEEEKIKLELKNKELLEGQKGISDDEKRKFQVEKKTLQVEKKKLAEERRYLEVQKGVSKVTIDTLEYKLGLKEAELKNFTKRYGCEVNKKLIETNETLRNENIWLQAKNETLQQNLTASKTFQSDEENWQEKCKKLQLENKDLKSKLNNIVEKECGVVTRSSRKQARLNTSIGN